MILPESLKNTVLETVLNIIQNPNIAQKILNFDRHKPQNVKHLLFMWINKEEEEGLFLLIMDGRKGGTAIKPIHQSRITVSSALSEVVSSSCKIVIIPNLTPSEVFSKIVNKQGIKFIKIIDKPNCIIAVAKK